MAAILSTLYFSEMGYTQPRQLRDGTWVALLQLMFTTGICVGLDRAGYARRYCFDDIEKCLTEYQKLQSINDEPKGWIAKRPEEAKKSFDYWSNK